MVLLWIVLILPLSCACLHAPVNLTRVITDVATEDILNQTSDGALRLLVPRPVLKGLVCGAGRVAKATFTPVLGSEVMGGGAGDYYCKRWDVRGRETHGGASPAMTSSLHRALKPGVAYHALRDRRCPGYPRCNPIKITFREAGRRETTWEAGKTWRI